MVTAGTGEINAFHYEPEMAAIVFSFVGTGSNGLGGGTKTLGGVTYLNPAIWLDTTQDTETATSFFSDGSAHFSSAENIDALFVDNDGNIFLSVSGTTADPTATLGGNDL